MCDRLLNMPINTSTKHLPRNYWWGLESIEIKECIGMKWVMPRLNTHVFISFFNFSFLYLIFNSFSFRSLLGIANVKNKCWLCSSIAPSLNRISVFLEMFSIYITTVIIQWLFSYQNSLPVFLGNYKVMRKRTGRLL